MENQTIDLAKADVEMKAIRQEIVRLQNRHEELRQFVSLARKLFPSEGSQGELAITVPAVQASFTGQTEHAAPASPTNVYRLAGEASMKSRVLALSRQMLSERPYAHTTQLLAFIEAQGVHVSGANKNTTVSVILSRSDEFVSNRVKGWSLTKKNPQDVAASAGSSTA